ncbi:hypothetical protein EIP75_01750 [Aquabacterium soli]|uniref:Porin n=1 Tax=Aquabacterium soli TaxID=2493092 RepID=A0A3R8YRK7_9BURK|nr:putative porin [Aquabacterium soli]RRS06335.1 hypothetical protein EIP75_01750 [Aquabacterium soli]
MTSTSFRYWPALSAMVLALTAPAAHADERAALETLRQTTRNLIDALVEGGVLSREKADALMAAAEQKAAAEQTRKPVPAATTTADGKPVLRVPYVPDSVRNQIRDEVKEEVLAQAKAERWGVPNATPSWVDRIRIEGDMRVRYQRDDASENNTSAITYLAAELNNANGISRIPDFAAYRLTSTNLPQPVNDPASDRSRERVRLRLGVSAKVTDEVGVGVRLATGNATDRVSTNQTMGQNFNKYQLFVDRAFVRLDPAEWVTIQGGRIPNPWFSSEMTWNENLNFEGFAATFRSPDPTASVRPFVTLGYFPLRESTPPSRNSRSLWGAQVGANWDLSARTRVKLGLAYYQYNNLEGRSDNDYTISGTSVPTGSTYGQYEYPVGLRQKGNTVFETNPLLSGSLDTAPVWGLAYQFKPIVLTASAEFTHFNPFNIMVSAEYANNTAFSASDFRERATFPTYANVDPGGKRDGYQLKVALGASEVRESHDWQVQATYRNVGSDAVLDAFTDSDLGLGGTNLRGYILGFTYGLYRNSTIGVRYLAAENINSTINSNFPNATYKVNSLQVDFNVRF